MTPTVPPADHRRPWRRAAIWTCILLLLSALCWPYWSLRNQKPTSNTQHDVIALVMATKQYFQEYRAFGGADNASIIRELRGDNTREIVFLDVRAKQINAKGEFVDQWGTPYRMDVSDPANPRAWSCGPDKHDDEGKEGSDDIVSWR